MASINLHDVLKKACEKKNYIYIAYEKGVNAIYMTENDLGEIVELCLYKDKQIFVRLSSKPDIFTKEDLKSYASAMNLRFIYINLDNCNYVIPVKDVLPSRVNFEKALKEFRQPNTNRYVYLYRHHKTEEFAAILASQRYLALCNFNKEKFSLYETDEYIPVFTTAYELNRYIQSGNVPEIYKPVIMPLSKIRNLKKAGLKICINPAAQINNGEKCKAVLTDTLLSYLDNRGLT